MIIMSTDCDVESSLVYRGAFFWSWLPKSAMSWKFLKEAEQKLLSYVKSPYRTRYVDLGPIVEHDEKIWTIEINSDKQKSPLVLLHGFGAGIALWCMNFDGLSNNSRPVYAMDLLGFGRSSRPQFSSNSEKIEKQFVNSIEKWRTEMKIEKCILLGHSFGGYLATAYTLQYPERVQHLILVDPWGFPEERKNHHKNVPWWVKGIFYVIKPLNPLWPVRFAGPFGNWIVANLRSDILMKYEPILGDKTSIIGDYIYQCNSQRPTGESAFHHLLKGFGWAKNPMIKRFHDIHNEVPITFIYGQDTWMDQSIADVVKKERLNGVVNIEKIPNAGHHVFADQYEKFNDIVNKVCQE
ncbi:(Lyso)-N-acylphosphatidylethanolamine lipase [Daktulosphaira vitifoliae]|uniref:(Lyso)-N-acylphosphatidylethanolamine lipase n=1 Tax=Daktulosphaira vitifoliae TaxID=58002 RepID=UPI0021A9A0F1|nr:(Lyso)-N-acylphosphatidylethanolamine lipase [Daktulosphaira vitifoliae]